MIETVNLYLYTTTGCHLCEQAQELLEPVLENSAYTLVMTEIADDEQLMERYGIRIPVIKREDTGNELGWPFDSDMARSFLTG